MGAERIRLAASLTLLVVAALGTALRLASPWRAFYWNDEIWTAVQSTGHSLDGVVRFTESPRAMHVADFTALQEFDPSEKFGTFLKSDPHPAVHRSTITFVVSTVMARHSGDFARLERADELPFDLAEGSIADERSGCVRCQVVVNHRVRTTLARPLLTMSTLPGCLVRFSSRSRPVGPVLSSFECRQAAC